ncbi:Uncharacterised protein [Mycobacteroides abscessus subsp. abscessus]|nr:Uncharacterised protein [Mycobacteroides abscessus subsp. abscessus]
MPRIRLVRDQGGHVVQVLLEVGVDRDRGAIIALVVVESRPRLIADHLVLHRLGVGQRKVRAHPVAQRAGEGVHTFPQPTRVDLLRPVIGGLAFQE